jgi:hypothetical protein
LRQPELDLWRMPFWINKKRYKQIIKYNEEQERETKKNSSGRGSKSSKK